jgi:hypothetical protein
MTRMPVSFDFASGKSGSSDDFSRKLPALLKSLEASWTIGSPADTALIDELADCAKTLIKARIRSEFVWLE